MSNLIDIQSQINKLQKQAEEIKSKEFKSTVQDILAKMEAFGITVKDLNTGRPGKLGKAGKPGRGRPKSVNASSAPSKGARKVRKPTGPVAAKFKGPNGEVWSGRGLMPKWLSALIAQGRTKESFAVGDLAT